MKILLPLFFLVAPPSVFAADSVLVDIYRSIPGVQERFSVSQTPAGEKLDLSSNGLDVESLRFGSFVRDSKRFSADLDKMIKATSGKMTPDKPVTVLGGWNVEIRGEKIQAGDPRFSMAIDLMAKQVRDKSWRPQDVTQITLDLPTLVLTRTQYPAKGQARKPAVTKRSLQGLKVCTGLVEGRLTCRVDGNFIHIPKRLNEASEP